MSELKPHQVCPFPTSVSSLEIEARSLVERAQRAGFVVTIEQKSIQPPAMGHFETVVHVREARQLAEPIQRGAA